MFTDIENQIIELTCDPKPTQMFIEHSLEMFCGLLCTGKYAKLAAKTGLNLL